MVTFDLEAGEYIVLADLDGYNWGTLLADEGMANVVVESGHVTNLAVRIGSLTVTATDVDEAISGQRVMVYTQVADVNGNMVSGERVADGYTDNTGTITFELTAGDYTVISNFSGYNWGDATGENGESGVAVEAGENTVVSVELGQVLAAVRSSEGNAARSVRVIATLQETDARGDAVPGDRVDDGYTDNTGIWKTDLTPGTYCIVMGDEEICNLEVSAGTVTEVELVDP
jgi:GH15 family glucan-1,4-alpha-glucosidase